MRITRIEAAVAGTSGETNNPAEWPLLADVAVPPRPDADADADPPRGWVLWSGYRTEDTGRVVVAIPGGPSTGNAPEWQYGVLLRGEEVGTLLSCMEPDAVPEVFGAFLRAASPKLLGAVAGQLMAYVATAAARRGGTGA